MAISSCSACTAAVMVWTVLGGGPFAAAPVAAMLIATLGMTSYFGLVRHIMQGPMLAQILGTFGLALLLRYSAFWGFGANFMTLPDTLVGGTFDPGRHPLRGLARAGRRRRLAMTLRLHLFLTRTAVGSRMLAVSEDATAAQLMGIRPQRMQALAWAMAGAATGIAGALIATFFYTSPTVGETLAILAFVTVSFGGFGSVLGALVAGPDHRRRRIAVGLSDRPGLQGRRRLHPVRAGAVVPAARPDGQGDEALSVPRAWRSCWCWRIRCWSRAIRCSSGWARWCCWRRSAPRPGTSSAAMPARSRSAMPCSSASAPIRRSWSTPISAGRRSPARRSAWC